MPKLIIKVPKKRFKRQFKVGNRLQEAVDEMIEVQMSEVANALRPMICDFANAKITDPEKLLFGDDVTLEGYFLLVAQNTCMFEIAIEAMDRPERWGSDQDEWDAMARQLAEKAIEVLAPIWTDKEIDVRTEEMFLCVELVFSKGVFVMYKPVPQTT